MDGSAGPFVFLLQSAGIEELKARAEEIHSNFAYPCASKTVTNGRSFDPYDGFKVNFEIEFDHPIFKRRIRKKRLNGFFDHRHF